MGARTFFSASLLFCSAPLSGVVSFFLAVDFTVKYRSVLFETMLQLTTTSASHTRQRLTIASVVGDVVEACQSVCLVVKLSCSRYDVTHRCSHFSCRHAANDHHPQYADIHAPVQCPSLTDTGSCIGIRRCKTFYEQLRHGSRRYNDCLEVTVNQCGITSSQLGTLASDRSDCRSTCKSAVAKTSKYDEYTSWRQNLRNSGSPPSPTGNFQC